MSSGWGQAVRVRGWLGLGAGEAAGAWVGCAWKRGEIGCFRGIFEGKSGSWRVHFSLFSVRSWVRFRKLHLCEMRFRGDKLFSAMELANCRSSGVTGLRDSTGQLQNLSCASRFAAVRILTHPVRPRRKELWLALRLPFSVRGPLDFSEFARLDSGLRSVICS